MEDQFKSTSLVNTFPQEDGLYPHQLQVLADQTRFKALVWHRRARKTSTLIEKIKLEAHNVRNKIYWIVFPTKTQAKEAIWKDPNMLFRIIPPYLIERQNEIELTLYLKCGSIIILKGADEPDSLRGNDPYGIGFDEFDTMKYEAWQVLEPVIRANGGWAWFIGTFKGKTNLWSLVQKGREGLAEWKSWVLKASESKVIPDDQLAELRKSMSAAYYNQEMECEPLEGEGAVFRGVRAIATAIPHQPLKGHYYVMGVDLAKYTDFTVITVYDRQTNQQVYQDRFQTIEWPFQKKRIKSISDHYNQALVILDSTGLGDPIYDDLARAGVPIEGFKFTQQTKKDLVEKLSIYIEQKRIRILPIEETLTEFDNFVYEMGPTGQMRYGALPGFHDDIVISHGLAIWNLNPIYKETVEKPKTLIQTEYERAINDNYANQYNERVLDEWSG
jgi:hypothetical protein